MVWDHFLARDIADLALIERCYRVLEQRPAPDRLAGMVPVMIAEDWLSRYADLHFTCRALQGIGNRLRGPNRMVELAEWIEADYARLERDFAELWPALTQTLAV